MNSIIEECDSRGPVELIDPNEYDKSLSQQIAVINERLSSLLVSYSKKSRKYEILQEAISVFEFGMRIDLTNNTYELIVSNKYMDFIEYSANNDAFRDLHTIVEKIVSENYRYDAIDFCTPENVQSSLRLARALKPERVPITTLETYSEVFDEWLGLRFVGCNMNDEGFFTSVIFEITDISDEKHKEIEIVNQMQEQMDIIDSIAAIYECIYYIDMNDGTFFELRADDESYREVFGRVGMAQEKLDYMCSQMVSEEGRDMISDFVQLSDIQNRLENVNSDAIEYVTNDGNWMEGIFIAGDRSEDGKCNHIMWAIRSINAEKEREIDLIEKSNTDELTGLFNRRAYEEYLALHNDAVTEEDFVYVSMDVNGLKVINDTLGHDAGDELISGAAECMKQCFGSYGKVYRMGGDEFAAIIFASENQLDLIANDFEDVVISWKGKIIDSIAVSCGYVRGSEVASKSLHDIAVLADKRMYEAKSAYYKSKGVDRRGQKDAHTALCSLYTKILKVNLTDDSFQIINMDMEEKTSEKGFSNKISTWLHGFGKSGQVHPDDLEYYLSMTDLEFMRDYFRQDKTSLNIHYRRKTGDVYKDFMMEIIPAGDYAPDDQNLFLYVKSIDR